MEIRHAWCYTVGVVIETWESESEMKRETTVKTAGPLPLKMDCGRNPDMFVVVTNQGNHYATTYDPSAARLILAGPEMFAALKKIAEFSDAGSNQAIIARAAILRAEQGAQGDK